MSTRNISWQVKAASALVWQSYHLHVSTVMQYGNLNLLQPSGPVQACTVIAYIKLYCTISLMSQIIITAMLLLLIVKKKLGLGLLIMANIYFTFRENPPSWLPPKTINLPKGRK